MKPQLVGLCLVLSCVLGCGCPGGARSSDFILEGPVPEDTEGFDLALYQTTSDTFSEGNLVEWVDNGDVFQRIREDIVSAKSSVNILLFIWRPGPPGDEIADLLIQTRARGVECRVLVDPIGSARFEEVVQPRLMAGGCEVRIFRPIPADENLARNHRKLVIVDGRIGITGGFAFQEPWLGNARNREEWRDVAVRARGPVVAQMQQAFAENWQEAGGGFLPKSHFAALRDGPLENGVRATFIASTANPELTRAERLIQFLAKSGRKRVWIAQAYFTPNAPLLELLANQAKRGVSVRILAPGDENDHRWITKIQRKTYDTLLPSGAKVYEWTTSMLHSKTMLVDDRYTLVGSMNFDRLSYRFLEEGSLLVDDPVFAARAAASFEADVARSEEQTLP